MKVKAAIKVLEANGWVFERIGKGDHKIFSQFGNKNIVTVDGKPSDDIPIGTLRGMRKATWNRGVEMTIEVVIEQSKHNWTASSADDDLLGCVVATGKSRKETIEKFQSALAEHIAFQRGRGNHIADVTELKIVELVAV